MVAVAGFFHLAFRRKAKAELEPPGQRGFLLFRLYHKPLRCHAHNISPIEPRHLPLVLLQLSSSVESPWRCVCVCLWEACLKQNGRSSKAQEAHRAWYVQKRNRAPICFLYESRSIWAFVSAWMSKAGYNPQSVFSCLKSMSLVVFCRFIFLFCVDNLTYGLIFL